MKIDVTTACSMGCTHCASDCKTKGVHGKVSDLTDAMDFCKAWDKSGFVLLSGGEPFEHPQAATLVEEALTRFNVVAVATNGDRLSTDPGVYKAVRELKRRAGRRLAIQVTNDPLYYPKRLTPRQEYNLSKLGVKVIERVPVVNGQSLYPQGRALVNHADANWLTTAPKCVNLRLIARQGVTDLGELLTTMSARLGKFCTPRRECALPAGGDDRRRARGGS